MMSMLEWAKNEVAIAIEKEGNYGCACYNSAMRAFASLLRDGHSGMSIGFTKNILDRLIDGKPLTPIENTEEVWEETCTDSHDGSKGYRCKRMRGLYKRVARDGSVTYNDLYRYCCINEENPHVIWHNGFVADIYNEMYPLTLPYMPSSRPDVIVCDELLTDRKNGDYDTLAILYIEKADGERVEVNRYFKENKVSFTEISLEEYKERQRLQEERIKSEAEK